MDVFSFYHKLALILVNLPHVFLKIDIVDLGQCIISCAPKGYTKAAWCTEGQMLVSLASDPHSTWLWSAEAMCF